jgi:putative hemolysin
MARKSKKNIHDEILNFLSSLTAGEAVVPKPQVISCYEDESPQEVLQKFKKHQYSRMPILRRSDDKIIGYIWFKDFVFEYLSEKGNFKVSSIKRNVMFVPENMDLKTLFLMMKNKFSNICVVVDEYGNDIGIVTVEDIIEKAFGEIVDESDDIEDSEFEIQKISDNHYIVSAYAPIKNVLELMNVEPPEELDVKTVAGFLMFLSGSLPKYESIFEYKGVIFKVIDLENNRISKVEVLRK